MSGWYIETYGKAQISINLTNYHVTPLHVAFDTCSEVAETLGLRVTGSEIVGLVPLEAMRMAGRHYLKKRRRPYAPMLVPVANWYAAWIGSKMRLLTGPAWLRYERVLYGLLLGRHAPPCGKRALLLPRLPGRNLLDLLQRDPGVSSQSRLGLKERRIAAAQWSGLDSGGQCHHPAQLQSTGGGCSGRDPLPVCP